MATEDYLPDKVFDPITEEECNNLKNNTGLDGESDNCTSLVDELLPPIRQEVGYLLDHKNDAFTIFTNDESKCSDDDAPTLASWWSRVYRFSQAVTCILCAYDPFLSVLLKSGRYPQVLMGAVSDAIDEDELGCHKTGYPVWVKPDDYPTEDSVKPVTSDGVYQAVYDAILSVWHLWEEHPEFTYFAQTKSDSSDSHNLDSITGMSKNDTALVAYDGTDYTVLYTYDGSAWKKTKVLTPDDDNLTNFAVSHITSGYYADKGVYYFDDNGKGTWQVMDANLTTLEKRVAVLEDIFEDAVLSATGDTNRYMITTRANLTQANAVAATPGKVTLTFITG